MRSHDDEFPIQHKCNVWDYCSLSDDYIILFCVFCHQVVGYQKGNIRYIKDTITQYKKKEYSDETLNNSV